MSDRLDKYIADRTELTRSQVKKEIRSGHVTIGGEVVKRPEYKVQDHDRVYLSETPLREERHQYIMFYKPAGILSAVGDEKDDTVVEWIRRTPPAVSHAEAEAAGSAEGSGEDAVSLSKKLFPMGRLDKDTEGLLIVTDDGELAHRLLSPRNHVEKTYFVRVDQDLSSTDVEMTQQGMDIGEKRPTRPAGMKILSPRECLLTISEGKYHQVKRMFQGLGKQVVYLKRVEFGGLKLDEKLKRGQWRFLREEELALWRNKNFMQ